MEFTRVDKIILVASTLFVFFLYYFFWFGSSAASQVEIFVNGEKRYVYNLSENKTVQVDGEIGASSIEIRDGKVSFIHSPCSSQFCVRNGWHEHSGGFAACLPNGVSLHLTGVGKLYDAINF